MRGGGGNCLKYLKGGGTEDFKSEGGRGWQPGSRGGCLKKGGAATPLQTMFAKIYFSACNTILPCKGSSPNFTSNIKGYPRYKNIFCHKEALDV